MKSKLRIGDIEDCATMKVVGNKFDTPELWEEKEK